MDGLKQLKYSPWGEIVGIETTFQFAHEHADEEISVSSFAAVAEPDLLGPLRAFIGEQTKRTWTGTGFNLIWRPNRGGVSGPNDFFLELNMTKETLDFTDISGTGVGNRGFNQGDVFLGALAYLQQVEDVSKGPQHFEPGVWTSAPATTDPSEPATLVRMGSIPHGTTIHLQGVGTEADATAPQIETSSIVPFGIGNVDDGKTGLSDFPELRNININTPSRTPKEDVLGLDDLHLSNPNLFLQDALQGLTVLKTTTLLMTSDLQSSFCAPSTKPSAPHGGGGVQSMAFLIGGSNGPNANPARVTATFWIERVRDSSGAEFDQLQYSQRVLLNFNTLSWPHVSVATLRSVV